MDDEEQAHIDPTKFKFVLYASFANETEALGIDIYRALLKLQENQKHKTFELVLRLSNQTKMHWDEQWVIG